MKSFNILSLLAVSLICLFPGCKKDNYIEEHSLCPQVISTNPTTSSIGVALNKVITAKFNERVNPSTITNATFIVSSGTTPITGVVTYADSTATFTPTANLVAGTTFTGRITTGVRDNYGNRLQADYAWTFSTGTILTPEVISTDPTNNETGVAINKIISATFSIPMDTASLNGATFLLKHGAVSVSGVVSYSGNTASFYPTANLIPDSLYTATITTGAKDTAGVALVSNYVWVFRTGNLIAPIVTATNPLNNATSVPLNKIVKANFSMPMDAATLTTSTFTLKNGTTTIAGVVTYVDTTVSFTPSVALLPNATYTATITTGAKNLAGTPLATNYSWTFSTILIPAPTVTVTDPLNNAIGVPYSKVITAKFSMPMDAATLTATTFTIKNGTNSVTGIVSYVDTTVSFTPVVPLLPNTTYTATITTGAKNLGGIGLVSNYIWNFTTALIVPPTVTSTDPLNNATNVPLNKIVKAKFSVPMDGTTLTTSTFTLKNGTTSIAGVVTYVDTTVSFTPSVALLPNVTYTATITTGAKNLAGTALLSDYVWTFTTIVIPPPTVTSTDPLNNAIGVPLNKIVKAKFSVPMDGTTLTTSTFTLKNGTTSIAGVVTYVDTTVSFTPSVALLPNVTYTATITTGAKNLGGIALASNYVWNFTTLLPPTIVLTNPINNATSVPLNKVITVDFSVPMDPLTITTSSFILKQGVNIIAGNVSYTGNTASFTPASFLLSDNTYIVTVTTAAKNLAGTPLANDSVWSFSTVAHLGPQVVNLNTVGAFGIIAGVGVSNNAGFSVINDMNVGISPGVRSSITGFPPAIVVNGAIYASDDIAPPGVAAMLTLAKQDLTNAYLFAAGASTPAPATVSGDLGGMTLAPGIYKTTSTLLIQNGDLTLDAQGDANAVWIFQIASAFTTIGGAGGNVILSGGAQAKNVFWQTGSSATIGDFTSFKGSVLALTSVTMNSHATAVGRMLCINGAVVMTSTNIINKP